MSASSHRTPRGLFETVDWDPLPPTVLPGSLLAAPGGGETIALDPTPDDTFLEIFERVADPTDVSQLCDLYLGRVEASLPTSAQIRPELAALWRSSRRRRTVSGEEVLAAYNTTGFVKEMFNVYFRDDLYGALHRDDALLLSQGSVSEEAWGLPGSVKACIEYALARDWYGYSDSRGRTPAREAIARYESWRLPGPAYAAENVALTMGGTIAIASITDFLLDRREPGTPPALCGIPNYPPLVASLARRHSVRLVPTSTTGDGRTTLDRVRAELRPDTPLVLLQTAMNPTGSLVDEDELAALIEEASPSTAIVLDECHEWLGEKVAMSPARARSNVIRVSSLSKNWSAPGLKVGWFVADATFVDQFYEYASSTYGGPPSFFYTAVEVLARFERWRLEGRRELTKEELDEFEPHYMLRLDTLQRAYASYDQDREQREDELVRLRDHAAHTLATAHSSVHGARYSINIAIDFARHQDSYTLFRSLYREANVSVFPGLLTFCLRDGVGRITTARPPAEILPALDRVREFAQG